MKSAELSEQSPSPKPKKKCVFNILHNYRTEHATVKKKQRVKIPKVKKHSLKAQEKMDVEERIEDTTVNQKEESELSGVNLFEQFEELEVSIPYEFKQNELDIESPFDQVQRINVLRKASLTEITELQERLLQGHSNCRPSTDDF